MSGGAVGCYMLPEELVRLLDACNEIILPAPNHGILHLEPKVPINGDGMIATKTFDTPLL